MKKYILFRCEDSFNKKSHVLPYQYFCKDAETYGIKNYHLIKEVLCANQNDENVCILFYGQSLYAFELFTKIIKYMDKKFEHMKSKIIFFVFDFWYFWDESIHVQYTLTAIKGKHNYTILTAEDLEQIEYHHDMDFKPYEDKIIFAKIWCAYDSAFIDFNWNPIEKIGLGGEFDLDCYPERSFVSKHKEFVERIKYNRKSVREVKHGNWVDNNDFNKTLNQYLCCFTSSIRGKAKNENKYVSVHAVLLKVYEILAAGSLLLYPESEKEYLQ